ncbi:protein-glutamate O-methyltransferase CheR [Blastopirellula sp. JC732]|uniref:protein-glutamate O-methyltransferase n=1 Tax=Blastopirellula sediminis TaxID=2894196 RepID=A0A9X1MTZ7_9BACT|nr:protein-glutamate O-methyltransferase CheR [Blastopirellula sediminis]MCC9604655.1 protein-glutamate O-methyltransferase CheR [Blastopirellula sediminis]MCC9632047.1 protein-glutamate O-methyltransferase CheR [Blastopirellula sediminis]
MTVRPSHELVTDLQLKRYAKLIYDVAGVEISPQKKQLLSNRVRRRLKVTGIANFEDYYETLVSLPVTDDEWDHFLQEVTTHETYLFRDDSNWNWFRNEYLPQLTSEARLGVRKKSLRVWSAACSTGDEACTVACCAAEGLAGQAGWDVKIVGTDIGVGAVREANAARFGERSMRLVPEPLKKRFFDQAKNTPFWTPKSQLRNMMSFRQHNLLDPLRERPFDVVLLKNVLIYFNTESKKRVLENVNRVMLPGSILVLGAAEGVSDLLDGYERIRPWLYRCVNAASPPSGKAGV